MKRKMYNFNKGIVFILSFLMLGVVFNSCEKSYDETITSELSLKAGHIPDPCKEVCLVAGQHMDVGNVMVGEDDGDIYVTFNVTEPNVYLLETHVDIFLTPEQFKADKKISNGGAIPGKFEFKKSWKMSDMMTSYTVMIPKIYVDEVVGDDANCFFIATHAALSNGETAWGGLCDESDRGVTLGSALQFPGRNWSVYFEFCLDECETSIDFTYAWEDLNIDGVGGNDGDYNDLVIKSDVIKSMSELKISFFASARGASYDHAFKIRVPKLGIVDGENGVFGEAAIVEDGDDFIITVFESTKDALPQENLNPYLFAANTALADTDCEPHATAEIIISIDGDFVFDDDEPYYPFITVHPTEPSKTYDLNIWELDKPNGDFWTGADGKNYPNGIIIPADWKWPYERVNIKLAYEDFESIDNWDSEWWENLSDPTKVFDVVCD